MNRRWYEQPSALAELRAIRIAAVALIAFWLLVLAAAALAETRWAIVVEHTYDGAVIRVDQEMATMRYTGGLLVVEVVDRAQDGVFRSGFDGPVRLPPGRCNVRCE